VRAPPAGLIRAGLGWSRGEATERVNGANEMSDMTGG